MDSSEGTQTSQKEDKSFFSLPTIFFFNGITSLLSINTIFSSLDYFNQIYPSYNVYLYFPIPCFLAFFIVSICFEFIAFRFGLKRIIMGGIIGTILFTSFLVILSLIITAESKVIGFSFSLFFIFWAGFCNITVQLSFYALIGDFGSKVVSRFNIGTGFSNLVFIFFRILLELIIDSKQKGSFTIMIYFGIVITFGLIDLYLNKKKVFHNLIFIRIEKSGDKILASQTEGISENFIGKGKQFSLHEYVHNLKLVHSEIHPFPLIILLNFFLNLLLFPNLALKNHNGFSQKWSSLLYLLMYGFGDFVGKLMGEKRRFYNKLSIIYLLCMRFVIFLYTIPLMAKQKTLTDFLLNNHFFPYLDLLLFGVTTGVITNAGFILAWERAGERQKYAGIVGGIAIQFGIVLGSFLAIGFEKVVSPDI